MTWEEIIIQIRKQPEYKNLVEQAYYEEDLPLNVERFRSTEEFLETVSLLEKNCGSSKDKKILDIGSGNGISSVAFALLGYHVTAVEPDKSDTVGSRAIEKLREHYKLNNLSVHESFGENLPFENEMFDIVYIRQAMHHAADLDKFIAEASRVLKRGGFLLTVRDHVIYDEKDKQWFLESHPLHKFYGGENAFTEKQYSGAMEMAGLQVKEMFRYYESVINYFPMGKVDYHNKMNESKLQREQGLRKKMGMFSSNALMRKIYKGYIEWRYGKLFDERNVPGRMYTFLAQKA